MNMWWFARGEVDRSKRLAVWSKGYILAGEDPDEMRMDDNRRIIRFTDFRNGSSRFGWDFGADPVQRSHCRADDAANLRPVNLAASPPV